MNSLNAFSLVLVFHLVLIFQLLTDGSTSLTSLGDLDQVLISF